MSGILVWMVGGVAALNTVGIQTTTVVAVVGAAGLAIGLALQNSLSHFAAGVLLVSFRPFEVRDAIEGAGVAGMVDNIGLFSTTIVTADHVRITVPNSNLFSSTLKNNTVMGTRRVDLTVDIGDRAIDSTITQLLSCYKTTFSSYKSQKRRVMSIRFRQQQPRCTCVLGVPRVTTSR